MGQLEQFGEFGIAKSRTGGVKHARSEKGECMLEDGQVENIFC